MRKRKQKNTREAKDVYNFRAMSKKYLFYRQIQNVPISQVSKYPLFEQSYEKLFCLFYVKNLIFLSFFQFCLFFKGYGSKISMFLL